ncbi:hypothetical protein [Geomonas subterranea]|uniref:hypothetical protein n=1 Tax=Geomonas subterranea TaxID=2847989 RepID=UPI001CD3FBBF|nr:hypothetical protein [Geomonas fuzhouensis]
MTGSGKKRKESGDLRLGDALLGLPCLQRQRANLTAGVRRETGSRDVVECAVCGMEVPGLSYRRQGADDPALMERVRERFPGWQPEDGLCRPCLERFGGLG